MSLHDMSGYNRYTHYTLHILDSAGRIGGKVWRTRFMYFGPCLHAVILQRKAAAVNPLHPAPGVEPGGKELKASKAVRGVRS